MRAIRRDPRLDPAEITEDKDFADLDADSIDLIEVVNRVERDFGIQIEEQQLYDVETVGQFVDLIDRELAKAR
ncbi:MAG: acyl carrier protein [Acidimicrobiales bacterium]